MSLVQTVIVLADQDHGVYYVRTANSLHIFDLDERTVVRQTTLGHDRPGDGEPIHLVSLERCEVGLPAVYYRDGHDEPLVTTRVESIEVVL